MIHSYESGATVLVRLKGDVTNPTLYEIEPMNGIETAKMLAIQAHAVQAAREKMVEKSIETAIELGEIRIQKQIAELAHRTHAIYNSGRVLKGGKIEVCKHMTDPAMIKEHLTGLLQQQKEDLIDVMVNDRQIQALCFRGKPDLGDESAE